MNEILESLYSRKSVRVYTDKKISEQDKAEILCAAANAPTAGNQQLYTILDITNVKLKEALAVSCDNQPFIALAPLVLIFCADAQKWYDAYVSVGANPRVPEVGDLMLAVADSFIAAQNAVTAAESLGIGSCYIGDIMEKCEEHREMLALPEYVFPCAMLVFGYPTEQQKNRLKPERCPIQYIVHENAYHKMNDSELEKMLIGKAHASDYSDWLKAFCKRKYDSEFSSEMSRSVAKYLKSFQTSKDK
ncbi:MAG: nitroreductase family protein [Oscillospiraceae bacterium]